MSGLGKLWNNVAAKFKYFTVLYLGNIIYEMKQTSKESLAEVVFEPMTL